MGSAIHGGIVHGWNVINPECAVRVGDHIVEANGLQGADAIRKQMLSVGTLWLKVQRPQRVVKVIQEGALHVAPRIAIERGGSCDGVPKAGAVKVVTQNRSPRMSSASLMSSNSASVLKRSKSSVQTPQ